MAAISPAKAQEIIRVHLMFRGVKHPTAMDVTLAVRFIMDRYGASLVRKSDEALGAFIHDATEPWLYLFKLH